MLKRPDFVRLEVGAREEHPRSAAVGLRPLDGACPGRPSPARALCYVSLLHGGDLWVYFRGQVYSAVAWGLGGFLGSTGGRGMVRGGVAEALSRARGVPRAVQLRRVLPRSPLSLPLAVAGERSTRVELRLKGRGKRWRDFGGKLAMTSGGILALTSPVPCTRLAAGDG